ncbi:hypothetical protein [Mesorhizobium sp.]|uniref:hypothetical protein n=1 Tax=Mesorhizobium sp. TaxID=1871066 RepID=UPI000FE9CBD8|nr:hypothetical protein [Mesorhizobium sp.]RWO46321.1 MAG: hypothetical protein EOS13_26835 [Mesorhizobium sp.]
MNEAQQTFMQRFPGKELNDLPPEIRLQVANLSDVPDSEPVVQENELTDAQMFFLRDLRLSPDDIPNLTEEQRKHFDMWGEDVHRKRPEATPEAEVPAQSQEPQTFKPKTLNIAKLNAAGLSPERRLDIDRAYELLRRNPSVGPASGVSLKDIEWARLVTTPYLD